MKQGNMFQRDYGVLLALDVERLDDIRVMVEAGEELEGVEGYKSGSLSVLVNGLGSTMKAIRENTDKPIIHDQQKLVPDYPMDEPTEEKLLEYAERYALMFSKAGVDGVIIYPCLTAFDPLPQTVYTRKIQEREISPFVLGRITNTDVLMKEGGVLPDNTPELVYEQAAREDVEYLIMPGNRPDEVRGFMDIVLDNMPSGKPRIGMPGFGLQRGVIKRGFSATRGCPTYAIVGPMDCVDIPDKDSIKESLKPYCDEALSFL